MKTPDTPQNEEARQAALDQLELLESAIEQRFERVTIEAVKRLRVPICAISLIDGDRQWFKSIQGLPVTETGRDISFCGHAINGEEVFVIEDANEDERFSDNPLVTDQPNIRFYAGQPVKSPDGFKIGTLCVIDQHPRKWDEKMEEDLKELAALVEAELWNKNIRAGALQVLRGLSKEERSKLVDEQTRLWNRFAGAKFLEGMHQAAVEAGEGFCLGLLELQNMEALVEEHGQGFVAEAMRQVSKRMLSSLRANDFACKLGEHDFLLLYDTEGADEDIRISERLRSEINANPVDYEGKSILLQASVGLVCLSSLKDVPYTALLSMAEEELKKAAQSESGLASRIS